MSLKKFLHVILNDMQSYTPGRQLYVFLYPPLSVEFSLLICCKYYEFDFICINTCLRISFFDVEGGGFDQTSFFHPCCLICNLSGIVFFLFFFFVVVGEDDSHQNFKRSMSCLHVKPEIFAAYLMCISSFKFVSLQYRYLINLFCMLWLFLFLAYKSYRSVWWNALSSYTKMMWCDILLDSLK